MGRASVEDMLEWATEDQALEWHLTVNHFPPIHACFVPVAKQAIDRGVVATDDPAVWDEAIKMPNGRRMTVREIVGGMHLWPFIEARIVGTGNGFQFEEAGS
jgi:hypothetical protein